MAHNERELIRWLTAQWPTPRGQVNLGIGDDMAILRLESGDVLITSDMLLDGVHFDSNLHAPEVIGYKAIACSLSDCAAMAVRPVAATLSVALPTGMNAETARRIVATAASACDAFECTLAGGDTTSWLHPLVLDVAFVASPFQGIPPVRRSGARPGDGLFVTGPLGGSLMGKHLTFVPRVAEARMIAGELASRLHAMMDISDGLGIDLDRMCEASGVGAVLDESYLLEVASDAARKAADQDERSVLDHVLADGEDYELLIAAQADNDSAHRLHLTRVGEIVAGPGLQLRAINGSLRPLEPSGYEHL